MWDVYKPDIIKETTRIKRGTGVRRKVGEKTKMSNNFADFRRDPVNKEQLFHLLSSRVASYDHSDGKEVYITSEKSMLKSEHGVLTKSV